MDFILDVIINLLAYRIGVFVMRVVTGGRFKGESGFGWGWALAVGSLVMIAPLAAFIAWAICTGNP